MVSYAVTGATRGIGFGYVEHLSAEPTNQVFALIRNRTTAGPLEELAAQRKNIHIVQTDISSPAKLEQAAKEISEATGGSLDVLILNAASSGPATQALTPTAFHGKDAELESEIFENMRLNLFPQVYLINAFLPLTRQSKEKKIILISSPSGDLEFTRITGIPAQVGYSVAKAGANMIITKFAAELAAEDIKLLSLSPGWVKTDAAAQVTGNPEVRKMVLGMFHKLDPSIEEPTPVAEAVAQQMKVISGLTAEDSGKFLTHHGDNTRWL